MNKTNVVAHKPMGAGPDADHWLRTNGRLQDNSYELRAKWEVSHHASAVLCRYQQRLESRLGPLATTSREFWTALQAEVLSMTAVLKLQDAIPNTRSSSIGGVVAKLEMIVGADREIGDPTDFPWPHLASVLDDLKAIAGEFPVTKPDRQETRALVSRYLAEAKESLAAQAAKSAQNRGRQNDPEISDLHHPRFL